MSAAATSFYGARSADKLCSETPSKSDSLSVGRGQTAISICSRFTIIRGVRSSPGWTLTLRISTTQPSLPLRCGHLLYGKKLAATVPRTKGGGKIDRRISTCAFAAPSPLESNSGRSILLDHARVGVTSVYVARVDDLLLAAADKIARYVWRSMTGEAGNIVKLSRSRDSDRQAHRAYISEACVATLIWPLSSRSYTICRFLPFGVAS